ncbi:MAG: hypothetical protein HY785_03280 [Oscillatoriophycideae cyanobacterium NC_groundwater_1537_Pr4_S-0.65um_50_18]|nr:hypothetical protein [Oscillatoriophycideae cyanobacterium NC_groundwater_1537_Pr4_S-0.65um_50_18]
MDTNQGNTNQESSNPENSKGVEASLVDQDLAVPGLEPEEQELFARIEAARRLLPGWFIVRMMSDSWYFGLLTTNNKILGIQCIDEVYQAADGSIWMDVTLLDTNLLRRDTILQEVIIAPTSRTRASINVNHIIAAFELEDT